MRLPAHIVEQALRTAPPKVVLCGRTPERDVVLEDGRVGFTNFGEGIQVVDPYTGELHESRKQDVADCTRIIDALPEIDVVERPLGAHDVPPDTAALHNAEAIFSNTTKHATIGPLTGFCARKMIDMAAAIAGGNEQLRRRPLLSFLTCPVSPLKLVADCCRIIIEGVRAGVPVNVLSMAMAGGSAPVSLAGTLVDAQCRSPGRHHPGAAHGARRAGHLRIVDDGHGPALRQRLGGQPRVRHDRRRRRLPGALLPAAQLGGRCVGRCQSGGRPIRP